MKGVADRWVRFGQNGPGTLVVDMVPVPQGKGLRKGAGHEFTVEGRDRSRVNGQSG